MSGEIEKLFSFIIEIDKMKTIYRQTYILNEDRRETDAEHSWHMALMVPLLKQYSAAPIDENRTIKLCLAHDLVEIYAGDTYCYDEKAGEDKRERELASAEKLFSLLDEPLKTEIRGLWDEFEAAKTPEARFAVVMDRVQPVLLNLEREGRSWRQNGIAFSQVEKRISRIHAGSPVLYAVLHEKIVAARDKGWLKNC